MCACVRMYFYCCVGLNCCVFAAYPEMQNPAHPPRKISGKVAFFLVPQNDGGKSGAEGERQRGGRPHQGRYCTSQTQVGASPIIAFLSAATDCDFWIAGRRPREEPRRSGSAGLTKIPTKILRPDELLLYTDAPTPSPEHPP